MYVLMLSASSFAEEIAGIPAGHRLKRAHPTDLRPLLLLAWLWSSTARSALRTTSSRACPFETLPL